MKGRSPTKAEREWMDSVRELGCIVCIRNEVTMPYEVPPQYTAVHHYAGKTVDGAHFRTIGLCPAHHQTSELAYHVNPTRFENANGTENDLIQHAKSLIQQRRGET